MSDYLPHHVVWDSREPTPEVTEAKRLLRAGQIDQAIGLLEPLTATEIDDHEVFEVLGVAYAQKGAIAAAVGAFETAAYMNPAHPQTHFNLAQAYLRAGDTEGAREALQKSLRVDPTYSKARDALAALVARTDQK